MLADILEEAMLSFCQVQTHAASKCYVDLMRQGVCRLPSSLPPLCTAGLHRDDNSLLQPCKPRWY